MENKFQIREEKLWIKPSEECGRKVSLHSALAWRI